ncbi:MAG TPA: serine/threonine-protein kinase [Polyangiaceae bacterium]|jgi:serine/threonine-protein kinase|nr:serine/threonine-protein kinase [Polyangiaceae bacterium]
MESGQTIAGKYRLNHLLGTGGMASVWSATNVFTEREFAVKFLLPQVARSPEAARRFLLEAKVSARINHPNIIEVIDVGQAEDNSLFLVMELLSGASLDVAVRRRRPMMLVHDFLLLMRDVAEALAAAHRSGVIHRDLKPTNIFLHTDRDGRVVPKILDFGVSKILEEENNTALTVVGTVLGSPLYMSPEQAMGAEGIDGRTDVFAFGSILFEAISGQRAFDGPNFNALIVTIATSQPKNIDEVVPDVPEAVRSLIRQCLVTNKQNRLGSFDKIVEMLDAMMPDLAKVDIALAPPRTSSSRSDIDDDSHSDADATKAIGHPSDRPPPMRGSHAPPGPSSPLSLPMSSSGIATPNYLAATPSRRTIAITAGMLAAAAGVLVLAAAFARGDREPHAAASSQGTVISAVSGGSVAPKLSAAPVTTAAPSDVPVISVDSLPVAPQRTASKASGNGRLAIVASPGSCAVSVDGVSRGSTPLPVIELAAGPHKIECAPPSGKAKTVNVTVSEGASARYKFSLDD